MEPIKIGIIGFGTVGAGTFEVLATNRDIIRDRVGAYVVVEKIADLDIKTDRGVHVDHKVLTVNALEVIEDPEIKIVVELMGGVTKAKEYVIRAMEMGKHVVTANKALLAEHGHEIYTAAQLHGVSLSFEASVGGGIPIIGALKSGLSANRIKLLMGILNGTSNYILTRMTKDGLSYDHVVEEAVELGIAEDPPTLDVDGTDAAHKLAILMSLLSGVPLDYGRIYKEGIDKLTPDDIRFADEFGYRIKLLAIAKVLDDGLEMRVHPAMIPKDYILANVDEAFNAIYVEGDFVGPNLYYGLGAGRKPTGSAVVSDIMTLARHISVGEKPFMPPLGHVHCRPNGVNIQPIDKLTSAYYFRVPAVDRPGVLSKIAGILGEHQISISSVIQKGREVNGTVPVVMLTHEAKESSVRRAVSLIDDLDMVTDKTVMIRVERLKM